MLGQLVDSRQLSGANVWTKPFKFALSFSMHLYTFSLAANELPSSVQDQGWLRVAELASVSAAMLEFAYILIQAGRGRHSHFNVKSPFERIMYALMGLGALFLLMPAVLIGLAVALDSTLHWANSVRVGVASGFLGGSALTILTGSRMGSRSSHFAARAPAVSRKMLITGWSLDGGDLRPAHFLAVHAMQCIPIAAIFASTILPERLATDAVVLVSCSWALLTLVALSLASSGRPLPKVFGVIAIMPFTTPLKLRP
jgi:hypothetical protein